MFEAEQKSIEDEIRKYCADNGLPLGRVDWKWIPFSGHWGISTSFFELASQDFKQSGKKGNVGERAQQLAEAIALSLGNPAGFEKIEAVRGYLNLYFSSSEYAKGVIDQVLEQGNQYGKGEDHHEQVMVEFSQPNTHKAFHVGHLRNMFLGDAVCRILEFAGYDVIRANYIGDIGLHVIKWLWNYQKFHAGEKPGKDLTRWMGDLYAEADKRYDGNPEVEAEVRALFGQWDRRNPEIVALWKETRSWSMEGFDQVYNLLDIRFDQMYYESDVEEPGKEFVQKLIEKGLARDERPAGAVIIPLDEILGTNQKFRVLVVLRSDGTSLYSTKDLALAAKKFEDYSLQRSIYVIDVRQSLYMQQIYKTLELMGYDWTNKCYHLAYEIVNLPGNVTMSSRDGTVVLLEDLIREATSRAKEIVQAKNPELAEKAKEDVAFAVALGAIRYSLLGRENTKTVTFDWETALDFNGQAAPYIQYAYVRANSILRKTDGKLPGPMLPTYELSLAEIQLVDLISRFPKEVQHAAADLKPLVITSLAYELARAFSDFYNTCPVLQAEEPVRDMRLRLVAAARQAIGNALGLLGIRCPEVM
jgi:arginyl-tRNA synthetase